MKYFSMPADFKFSTIDKYEELSSIYDDSKVIETYGQITVGKFVNSGRITEVLPKADYEELERFVRYSKEKKIDFNYTLNPSCMGNREFSKEGVRSIKTLLRNLYNIGISSLTVTTPALIELVNSMTIQFEIKVSAICEIMTPDKAQFYKNIGANRVVVDPDITRDFRRLTDICDSFGKGVEIIVNNVCYKNCAYKMFHYNHEAHRTPDCTSQTVTDYYFNRCAMQKARGFVNVIRLNWIRPEDLKYYMKTGISLFKIQGRQNVLQGDVVRALEAYMKEDFEGNLYDLITIFAPYTAFQTYIDNKKLDGFVKKFFEEPDFCRTLCERCGYCNGYAHRSMDKKKTEDINKQALKYFDDADEFKIQLKEIESEPFKGKSFQTEEKHFEFE
jgi:collagenase-like PrtC family protease